MGSDKPLWQHGIDRLMESYEAGSIHLGRKEARALARGMRIVGERPPYRDVSRYIREHWNRWPDIAERLRDCWRSVDRAEGAFGRETHWHSTPLQLAEALIEEHEPQPTTEARLAAVAREAVDALAEAARRADTAAYLKRKRQLADALLALHHLRYLRQGSGALGFRTLNPGLAPRPRS